MFPIIEVLNKPMTLISKVNFSFLNLSDAEFGAKEYKGWFSSTPLVSNSIIPS